MLNGDLWRGRYGNAGEFAGGLPPNIYPFPNLELLRVLAARDGVSFETVDELETRKNRVISGWRDDVEAARRTKGIVRTDFQDTWR
ncbi:hypothetical protein SFOMI_3359 [Sphingobium fuliginis]|uniref:Uncharacterized protein n=2 Tax=Sphingobium fuliginis (strain ATCC 27551) TaxID=336203 RepID=A0A292ZH80_SPHSA|nr:hypothetical protein SFOMI_3359 [Sphingobium fuliginis]